MTDSPTSKPLVQRLREAQDCGFFHFELFKEAADEIEHREQFDLVPKGAADEPKASPEYSGRIMTLAECMEAEGGIEPKMDDETVILRRLLCAAQGRIVELERAVQPSTCTDCGSAESRIIHKPGCSSEWANRSPQPPNVAPYLTALVRYIDGWFATAIEHNVPPSTAACQAKHAHDAVLGICKLLGIEAPMSVLAKEASCLHKWTVLGAPRNPYPDQLCEGGCGQTYEAVHKAAVTKIASLPERQFELDQTAKQALYGNMRELYRKDADETSGAPEPPETLWACDCGGTNYVTVFRCGHCQRSRRSPATYDASRNDGSGFGCYTDSENL